MTLARNLRFRPVRAFLARLTALGLLSFVLGASTARATPIYVITERDGTIRFTNKAPAVGVQAEVFTAKGGGNWRYTARSKGRPKKLYGNEYKHHIDYAAHTQRVDPHLIKAVIHAESAFDPNAVSPKGAQGLMQIMPATGRELKLYNPFSPAQNILAGTKYLASLLRRYGNDRKLALAAYNAGPERVDRAGGVPAITETQLYVRRVLELERRYRKSG